MILTTFTPTLDAVGGSLTLSALCGLLPLLVFFVLLGVFKVKTHYCAIISLIVALLMAVIGFKMPVKLALLSATQGIAFGFAPILFIIIAAVWLYNLTERSGRAADVQLSFNLVARGDQRAAGLLIAFSFCGLLEGLAGFGAPVAIVGAMLVTMGIKPIKAAIATIVGNAINVGFGAMAIPVTTAGKLGGQSGNTVAFAMGHITPYIACFVPLILLFILDGIRGIKQLWLPAIISGAVTAFGHFWCASYFSYELTAVVASLMGFIALTVVLQFLPINTPADCHSETHSDLTIKRAVLGLLPYWLVVIVFGIAKIPAIAKVLSATDLAIKWPGLYGQLLDAKGNPSKSAILSFQSFSNPWMLISITALIVIVVYSLTDSEGRYPFTITRGLYTLVETIVNLRLAILTIAMVMGLALVMNFSGQTSAIGAWMAGAGLAFAFLAPIPGWLGTAVAGSATSANALFAKLQATAATQLSSGGTAIDPNVLLAGNTIGGGLGKIVSPQNLAIAAGAVGEEGVEPLLLRKVAPFSIVLLAVLCVLVGLASMHLLPGFLG